jgi:hypothetical protein
MEQGIILTHHLGRYHTTKDRYALCFRGQSRLIFIDRFAKEEVMEKEQQDFLKMSCPKFIDKALADSEKKSRRLLRKT